jgi:hypothetical protein
MPFRLFAAAAALSLFAAGCGGDNSPTTPSDTATISTTFVSGSLEQGGTTVSPFTLNGAATIRTTLVSLVSASGVPLAGPVALGTGTVAADGSCVAAAPVTVSAALTTQATLPLQAGSYCVNIADLGNLTEAAVFSVRVDSVTGTPSSGPGAVVNETFSSNVTKLGTAVRQINVTGTGDLSATLLTAGVTSPVLGFAIGAFDGANCLITKRQDVAGSATSTITAPVEAGSYCVKVVDIGNLTDTIGFVISISHP